MVRLSMKTINEYLLSKKNNKLPDDKYYVILPGRQPLLEFQKTYTDEEIHQYKLSSFDYWIMTGEKILVVLDRFSRSYLEERATIKIWEVPTEYDDIDEFKQRFINAEIDPWTDLKRNEITINDLYNEYDK